MLKFINRVLFSLVGILFLLSLYGFLENILLNILSFFILKMSYESLTFISAPIILIIGWVWVIISSIRSPEHNGKYLIRFSAAIKNVPDWMQIGIYFVIGNFAFDFMKAKYVQSGETLILSRYVYANILHSNVSFSFLLNRKKVAQ